MYILITIQNGNIATQETYTDINSCKARYHTELAYRHESRESTICIILNEKGDVIAREGYFAE